MYFASREGTQLESEIKWGSERFLEKKTAWFGCSWLVVGSKADEDSLGFYAVL